MKDKLSKIFPLHPFYKKWEYIIFIILGPFLLFSLGIGVFSGEFNYFLQNDRSIIGILGYIARVFIIIYVICRLVFAEKKFKEVNNLKD